MRPFIIAIFAASAALALAAQDAQPPAAPPRQSGDISITINGAPGLPPKYAVPDFIALTNDAETVAAAKTMGEVLWDDLNFEREFYLIPRDTYKSIPPATSIDHVPLDQWKQLGADGAHHRHRAEDPGRRCRAGAAAAMSRPGVRRWRRNTPGRSRTRASTPTPPRTKSISSSARCAASHGPSSRSRPTATANG